VLLFAVRIPAENRALATASGLSKASSLSEAASDG
jgi:hypothetical protein